MNNFKILFLLLLSFNLYAASYSDKVIYGVVPALFGDQPFKGVQKRLPELKKLGVDILWFSPIYSTDDLSLISYSTTDYFNIRPDLGTKEEFAALVKDIHKHGMKIILDIVPNHTSNQHPYFLSPEFYDYFDRNEDGEYTYYFDWKHLPNLNFKNQKVRKLIRDAFVFWIEEFNVDGYRVDAAWGVKERSPEFWKPLIQELHAKKKDVIMLAEAGARDPYYLKNGYDLAYDWTKDLGIWSWTAPFKETLLAPDLMFQALKDSPHKGVARFINNNDTGKRFITQHGKALTKIAATLMFTTPGTPIVYTGDEIGAEFEPYADPAPISWADRKALLPFYKKLIEIKKTEKALHGPLIERVKTVHDQKGILAFTRGEGADQILIVVNFDRTAKKIELNKNSFKNLLDNKELLLNPTITNKYSLHVSAHAALILK